MAAKLVGGARNPLSGSTSLHTSGDVIHPQLYVEVKYRKRHGIASLMRDTVKLARKEGKLPIIVLQEHGSKSGLLVVRTTDVTAFLRIMTLPDQGQFYDEPDILEGQTADPFRPQHNSLIDQLKRRIHQDE